MSGIARFRARLRGFLRRIQRRYGGRSGAAAHAPSGRDAGRPRGTRLRDLFDIHTVAGQVFSFMLVIVVLLITAASVALISQGRSDSMAEARNRSSSVAETFAHAPGIVRALDSKDPAAVLQPLAEQVRRDTDVDFVVVANTRGIRYTHPDPRRIGEHIGGPYQDALTGGTGFTRTLTGTQGRAVYSVVPVLRPGGSPAGVVSVGITVRSIDSTAGRTLPLGAAAVGLALVLTTGGAALLSRRLGRLTHGLGPAEMTRMYEHHDAVLHAVREGVLIIGADHRLLLANDEARRLLDLAPDAEGRGVADLGLDDATAELLFSGRTVTDEVRRVGNRLVVVNLRSTGAHGGPSSTVATLRDTTELRAVTGRAELVHERLLLLYEAGERIGTTLDVATTAQELADVATPGFADYSTVDLAEPVLRGDEPSTQPAETMYMCRSAIAGPDEDHPLYRIGDQVGFIPFRTGAVRVSARDADRQAEVVEKLGRRGWDPDMAARILGHGFHSLLSVPLHARGVVLGMVNFWRQENEEPFDDDDLSFAEELVARAAVSVDNARRYTREHEMAVTLQRSLLPQGLPEQNALDVAFRYLPARSGVGGDWFDVIPLSGARVALVVGDVIGHGLHAAATMGRLRTSVHNFSTLDLPPDELLGHLDELVSRIDQDETAYGDGTGEIAGATCMYAIYDAVSGSCSVARAGHPGPAVVLPDGTVEFPEIPAGLPLGIGGMPYETAEIRLPEGSRLVLFTDGLIERRDRDFDAGTELLRSSLEGRDRTPEETCADVLDVMLSGRPSDDIALLVARTRTLDPDRVARWDVVADPSAVAGVRKDVSRWLSDHGLDEEAFTTELILSELVTNAVRYGSEPIEVRLLHDRGLICEVSDTSSTSPHLRYAASTDEGGRGLFLVAQFAERWGTRYTGNGKVIWCEQSLDEERELPDLLAGF